MADTRPGGPLTRKVAANLRAIRRARGLSAQRLADQLPPQHALTRAAISKVECGERGVSLEELAALAAFFGLTNPWDLTGDVCATCASAPPPGMRCVECNALGVKR